MLKERSWWFVAVAILASSPARAEVLHLPMCRIRDDGVEKTRLVPPAKVQRALEKGLTRGECTSAANGRVLCRTKRGKRANVLVPEKEIQRLLEEDFFAPGECGDPDEPLPPLVSSSPADGETVSRSAWLVARFAGEVAGGAEDGIWMSCAGSEVPHSSHRLAPEALLVNPNGGLPADAACLLGFLSETGPVRIHFQTAPEGPPFEAVYDRRDPNRPLPFPDDYFLEPDPTTATGLRPDVVAPDHDAGVHSLLTKMASVAAQADGWSPIGSLAVQLSAAPDPATLPLDQEASLDPLASVGLFDLTPGSASFGERVPFELTIRADAIGAQPPTHALLLFPGIRLEPLGRYGLVLTDRVLSEAGEPLGRSGFFAEVVGEAGPGADPEVLRARPLAEEVLDALEALDPVPIPRDDVALAARITVRSIDRFPDDLLAMREDIHAAPVSYAIDTVTPRAGNVAAIVRGSYEVPDWTGGAPFLQRGADGRPQVVGTSRLDFVLALPRSAATDGFAPLIMYQHGNPGSAESEVPGSAEAFLAQEGFAVGGFTDVLNRNWPTTDDQNFFIFGILLFTGDVVDLYLQTYAEQMAFLRLLRSLDTLDVLPVGAPDGIPDLDPTAISYEGISNGSNHGQAFLAYAPEIRAACLVAGASRIAEVLEYQDRTLPGGGQPFLTVSIPSFVPGATASDIWMGLGLFSVVYDRKDPQNHASFLYREPVEIAGTTRKPSILVLEGIGDTYIKNNSTRSLAWLLGPIPHLAPPLQEVSYLPVQAAPIQGNVDAETTAAFVQFAPDGLPDIPPSPGCVGQPEGHFCAQVAPESRRLRADFYRSALADDPPVVDW